MKQKRCLVGIFWVLSLCSTSLHGAALADSIPIQHHTLPSGQAVYIQENHAQPIVTIDTWVKTGSVNETPQNNGVSHFLEHLLFKGTATHPPGAFDRLIESKGGKFNAATSNDFTHYYITIASPFLEEALKLHADMLLNAAIPADELVQERKVVQEEINRATDNPQRQLFMTLTRRMFGNHGYGLDTLGPKANIANIPRQQILDYYHHWYRPKNMSTVIVGDVDPKATLALVERYFGNPALRKPQRGYRAPAVQAPKPPKGPQVEVLADPNISQAYLSLAFPAPGIDRLQDAVALDVAALALGQGRSSRLYQALREQRPLVTDVQAANWTQRYSGTFYINLDVKPENLPESKDVLMSELSRLLQGGVTADELAKAKTQTIKNFVFDQETTDGVAQSLGYYVTIGKLKDYTDYVATVQKMTLADVQQAARKYLDVQKAVWVSVLPQGSGDLAAETKDLQARLAAGTPVAAATAQREETPTAPVITRRQLANGMTLITKPLKGSQTVALKIFIRGGELVEPVPGLSSLLSTLFLKGTTERSAEALNRELEARGMKLSIVPHEDYLVVSGNAVADDLGELFLVLSDVLNRPAFDEKQIAQEKALLESAIRANRDNPSGVAFENLTLALYPNHPYGNVGQRILPHLQNIRREDLLAYYQRYFVPSNMVVSVAGAFDPQVLENYLLSAFPAKGTPKTLTLQASPLQTAPTVPPLKASQTVEEGKATQAATWIAQGWLAPALSDPDAVPLKVLNALLGSGMSSRLFVNLREKQGLAYAVSSLYPGLAQGSHFVIYIGTDPKNREAVEKGFHAEIQRLKDTRVPDAELQEAKDKLKGAFALAHETPDSQALYLGLYETLGLGYAYDAAYPQRIDQVTAADIQRVAQKYFSQPSVLSVVAPQPVKK